MKRALSIACAALAVATLAGAVAADNGHLYPGSYCKTYYASTTADLDHLYPGIYNRSNSSRLINCPVLVDEGSDRGGTSEIGVYWTAYDNKNDILGCNFCSLAGNGSVRQCQYASKTGSGWMPIPNITNDDSRGSYVLLCSLPGFSSLNMLLVNEKE